MSNVAKKQIAKCFTEREFLPNQIIVEEDHKTKVLHIIVDGECVLKSQRNPLTYSITEEGSVKQSIDNI